MKFPRPFLVTDSLLSLFTGDKSQNERDWVMRQFKDGRSAILVATDVAARGLDVKEINYVINFDLPKNIEDYVHHILSYWSCR